VGVHCSVTVTGPVEVRNFASANIGLSESLVKQWLSVQTGNYRLSYAA